MCKSQKFVCGSHSHINQKHKLMLPSIPFIIMEVTNTISASSLKLHEVRILSVFQGKHGPQIAEEQLLLRVLANHIQQLFVHLCLILFALIGHSIHLQTECCLSVSMASYIVHKLKVHLELLNQ